MIAALALAVLVSQAAPSRDWVWWEAEAPKATNFPSDKPFGPWDPQGAAVLSGGTWISAKEPAKTLFLEYDVRVPKDGPWRLYVRKFWEHGAFRYRFDDGPWGECDERAALIDQVDVAKFIPASWALAGPGPEKAGTYLLRIELLRPQGAAAFDCFVLSAGAFTPRGKLKPGEKYGSAPEGWFAFEPDADPFGASALDLRDLNERTAGEKGRIVAKGDAFVHEKTGEAVRFWAVNAGHGLLAWGDDDLDRYARQHAKLGVNMIRLHGPVWREDDLTKVDEAKTARIHRFVAALKKEGIYLNLSTYFPIWMRPKGVAGLAGFDGDKHPFAVPFFNESFQAMQRGWWKGLFTPKNPHTGLSLAEDPAVAFVEIQNEDGIFFWTFTPYQNVPAAQMEILERKFGDWLKGRHGSVDRAFSAWKAAKVKGDDAGAGRAGFMPLWEVFNKRDARARDTAEFLARMQRSYYDSMSAYLKETLGFRGCVTGSNWATADARTLGPLDKWSNAGCDFMDRHGYYGGPHKGDRAGYSVSDGDTFDDASALRFDGEKKGERNFSLPIMDLAWNGKPSTISEINWVPPNRFRAEMPLVCAAWGSLQGSDGFFFFAHSIPGYEPSLGKFTVGSPAGYGQFPAAALMYRKGLVRTADPVVRLEVKLADLLALQGIPVTAPQNLDEFRKKDVPAGAVMETAAPGSIDPLAFLCGRVEAHVGEAGGVSRVTDLSKWIDRRAMTARSVTGELWWDWGRGLSTVDAPAAQGVVGFLSAAGKFDLRDVVVESTMDYGAVVVVAMDGDPLGTSKRILVQVMSEDRNTGWSAPGSGMRKIEKAGGPPIVVRKFSGKVAFKRADAAELGVTALDANGYPDAEAKPGRADALDLLPSTLYYIVRKK